MAKNNDELLKKLLATFRVEADEHLQALSSGLLALKKTPAGEQQAEIIEQVFREVHSLKGAARAVNLTHIESICQSLESAFAGLKDKRLTPVPPLFDLLHQAVDVLAGFLAVDASASGARPPLVATLIRRFDDVLKGALPASAALAEPAASTVAPALPLALSLTSDESMDGRGRALSGTGADESMDGRGRALSGTGAETVRVSSAKLDAVMRQVEGLLVPCLTSAQHARELREVVTSFAAWNKQRGKIQPALRLIGRYAAGGGKLNGVAKRPRELTKLLEHLDAEHLFMKVLEQRLLRLDGCAEHDRRSLAGMSDGLLHDVKAMHLLPFSLLIESFPRFTRELARDQGKQVELAIQGGEIKIDRRILEEMKDPLIHLLRNGIDHGIEQPAVRMHKRKPAHGTITLAISQKDSGKVEILVADDGAGIAVAKVKAAARKLGVVSAEEVQRLGEPETLALVFHSGVTTSPIITDVSGRGLGLAIVREKVERLGGSIAIESRPDGGTAFRITLPLTLANFRGVLVCAGGQLFIIPAARVERVTRVADKDIRTVENRETIVLDGQAVALVWLSDALELPRTGVTAGAGSAIVLGLGVARIAFRVDAILGEQEVLVKTLGRQLVRVRNVAGASVLGTGQVVPVLNVPDLLKSAVQRAAAVRAPIAAEKPAAAKASILVVEDSITSRALLKNILESAGYRVSVAVDGIDAYTTLKTATFDLLVSDVEMPRMDGFDLTAKVRADKQLAQLPVVLVTALGSREHRERGIDVGANAYIVKSSFDQSNLLEIVRRLI